MLQVVQHDRSQNDDLVCSHFLNDLANCFLCQALAKDIASDELAHVIFLRTALGAAAVSMPQINLKESFANAADAALKTKLSPPFSPYGSNAAFLFGAFIFEDVGATAYKVNDTSVTTDIPLLNLK